MNGKLSALWCYSWCLWPHIAKVPLTAPGASEFRLSPGASSYIHACTQTQVCQIRYNYVCGNLQTCICWCHLQKNAFLMECTKNYEYLINSCRKTCSHSPLFFSDFVSHLPLLLFILAVVLSSFKNMLRRGLDSILAKCCQCSCCKLYSYTTNSHKQRRGSTLNEFSGAIIRW